MKTIKLITITILFMSIMSCSKNEEEPLLKVEAKTVTNIKAKQTSDYTTNPPTISGDYVGFSFETGEVTTSDDWDIAFRGTTIIVNGGSATNSDQLERVGIGAAYIATGSLAEITEVDVNLFVQDNADNGLAIKTGSGNGWYNYNPSTHVISPIAGKVLVIKTHDGKYAKLSTSYYKDGDESGESQHYSFNYVYQPNSNLTTF